jgi:hypothetical protein
MTLTHFLEEALAPLTTILLIGNQWNIKCKISSLYKKEINVMKLKRKTGIIAILALIVIFIISIITACATDTVTPQASQLAFSSIKTTEPVSAPTPSLFPEPSMKPSALSSSVKWNPYRGEWYDSSEVELDPTTHDYKGLPFTIPPGYIPPKVASITAEEWIAQHQESTDTVNIAIINYYRELVKYIETNNLHLSDRSNWQVGQGEDGPLTILTDLGISRLQKLIDRVQWENPFVVNIEIAICEICRTRSSNIGGTEPQVNGWTREFDANISSAKLQIGEISQELKTTTPNEKAIQEKIWRLGIFALPEVYELVINQGNTDLVEYLPDILPLDKVKSYNIQTGLTDDATLKQALTSCVEDIKIIQTLHTN